MNEELGMEDGRWRIEEGRSILDPPSSILLHPRGAPPMLNYWDRSPHDLFDRVRHDLLSWDYDDVRTFLDNLERTATDDHGHSSAIMVLTLLMDRSYSTGTLKRSCLLSLVDRSFANLIDHIRRTPFRQYAWMGYESPLPEPNDPDTILVVDARGYPSEGNQSLSRAIVTMYQRGVRRFIVARTRGQRFIGCGLGPNTHDVRIDVFGSAGDYLASGIDGAEIIVHDTAQDQLAQIMKAGTLVVYGDVGQTFMYAAKGGTAFILGNAAGRPLINAVGRPRVVINGTCLDYLAESFMAGDPHNGGGFVVVNGLNPSFDGSFIEQEYPYPGGNLFSLASGGAIFIRDPYMKVSEDQLNGGRLADFTTKDWELILPYLKENARLFGISVEQDLLTVDGKLLGPSQIYRKIEPISLQE